MMLAGGEKCQLKGPIVVVRWLRGHTGEQSVASVTGEAGQTSFRDPWIIESYRARTRRPDRWGAETRRVRVLFDRRLSHVLRAVGLRQNIRPQASLSTHHRATHHPIVPAAATGPASYVAAHPRHHRLAPALRTSDPRWWVLG
jgi:hypothetical protein